MNTIGHRAAERALQLGLLFPPAEALQVGIVDKVVPEDQVQSTVLSVMAQWLAIPGEEHRDGATVGTGEQAKPPSLPFSPRPRPSPSLPSLILLVRPESSHVKVHCASQEHADWLSALGLL